MIGYEGNLYHDVSTILYSDNETPTHMGIDLPVTLYDLTPLQGKILFGLIINLFLF